MLERLELNKLELTALDRLDDIAEDDKYDFNELKAAEDKREDAKKLSEIELDKNELKLDEAVKESICDDKLLSAIDNSVLACKLDRREDANELLKARLDNEDLKLDNAAADFELNKLKLKLDDKLIKLKLDKLEDNTEDDRLDSNEFKLKLDAKLKESAALDKAELRLVLNE
ncbi:hypothetical protein PT285_09755 [Lactobacillus sp. ESL0791]|uniref:hypothetical protein n=1 Tax=Lactobacillus sp. ESL0791 TaxID=2983234 RepID=UPI0023F7F721|nr:hypothetical protein [Lactobacillus sp. ESL0791]MDF7639684.1 hypothetical protein [Lactobacillus sp. ESL0791]